MSRSTHVRAGHELSRQMRTHRRRRPPAADALAWRFRRALARVEPRIDPIVAEHATAFWQRGVPSTRAGAQPGTT